jgi:uncharacterized protein (TIGR03435 family)
MRKSNVLAIALCLVLAAPLMPQSAEPAAFDVASVKANKSTANPTTNFPIGPGDAYTPNGGYFNATNLPLIAYIAFAYKLTGNRLQHVQDHVPDWVITERFDVQARVAGNPGKDQMRLLMRALLADRFKLTTHEESQEMPVAALVLAKEGKLGPQLQPHPADQPCPTDAQPNLLSDDPRFPLLCGGLLEMQSSAPGRTRYGARNVTIDFIATILSRGTSSGRPMVNQSGLTGTFDFNLEWTEDKSAMKPGEEQGERSGPTFEQALREQLGFKLEAQKAALQVLVLDHVERPTDN